MSFSIYQAFSFIFHWSSKIIFCVYHELCEGGGLEYLGSPIRAWSRFSLNLPWWFKWKILWFCFYPKKNFAKNCIGTFEENLLKTLFFWNQIQSFTMFFCKNSVKAYLSSKGFHQRFPCIFWQNFSWDGNRIIKSFI